MKYLCLILFLFLSNSLRRHDTLWRQHLSETQWESAQCVDIVQRGNQRDFSGAERWQSLFFRRRQLGVLL